MNRAPAPTTFSDLVVYADESGDHGLDRIDPGYPIFVLAFVIMRREDYVGKITPALQRLKFKYWGHDQVVFHEREIRKKLGPFSILTNSETKAEFMEDLSALIENARFRLAVAAIDKSRLVKEYSSARNPYELALSLCMERLLMCMRVSRQGGKLVHVIFEARGRNEDNSLELEFRRIAANQARWGEKNQDFLWAKFEPIFARKDANAAGLQLADLVARPCGLRAFRPNQANRAFDALRAKLVGHDGWRSFP